MKTLVVFACLLATVLCAPVEEDVQVLRHESEVNPDSFKYAYELDNSVKAEQQGELLDEFNWNVAGQYQYISPEGEQIQLSYTADENGYHPDPSNPLLPTPHPIPDYIQRSLEYLAAHPPPGLDPEEITIP